MGPIAGLDNVRDREVVELLSQQMYQRGKAAVMVDHDGRVLDLCDRVVSIVDSQPRE